MSTSTLRACPKCSTQISGDSKFCPSCGAAVSGIFSGGGSALDGTAVLAPENVDTVFPLLQEATLGDYDIYGELGRGGMAAVYLALDLALNRKVAIKTMLPDLVSKTGMVDRFKREAQTAAALSHPHIIQIFSVKQTKSLVYFVMKYIEGRSLESVIVERGKLDVDLTRVILSQVGGALAFAHRKGVVHRDMKPANIMLEEDGWAIVTDFGIAKVQEAQNLTATGTAIGTPHYMSPEQFHNKAVTGASDQYSLGIVAYEMLTGKKPFDGGTYAEIITQHLFEAVPDLRSVRPDIPANVAEAVMRMMSKDASARFPDLDAAVAALGTATTTQGEKAKTQMIQLAKAGGPRPVRMSVPQSPVPVGAGQRKSPAPTVVEDRKAQAAAAAAARRAAAGKGDSEEKKKTSMAPLIAALLLLAVGGGGTWAYMSGRIPGLNKPAAPTQLANQNKEPSAPQPSPTQSGSAATTPDSTATNPPAAETKVPEPKPAETKPVETKPVDVASGKSKTKTTGESKTASGAGGTKTSGSKTSGTKSEANSEPKQSETKPADTKPAAIEGTVYVGTPTDGAVLYINDASVGIVKTLANFPAKAKSDGTVHVQIKADNCKTWDSTFTLTPGVNRIGKRPLECGK
jgi:hypothetical protein